MERVAEDFVTSLQGLDFATQEEAPHPVLGVDRSLALGYFNPAWFACCAGITTTTVLEGTTIV